MAKFITFMQSGVGRVARSAIGVALIALGISQQGFAGSILVIIGLIPLIAGIAGVCLFAPLVGYTLQGKRRLRKTGPLY